MAHDNHEESEDELPIDPLEERHDLPANDMKGRHG